MMTEWLLDGWVALAGAALGVFFFGGLWWSVQRGLRSPRPALWFAASLLLRISVTLAGFYGLAGSHWQRWLLCLFGFVVARLIVTAWLRPRDSQLQAPSEAPHAPDA
jgi:F1F0 ATPase subunit 2